MEIDFSAVDAARGAEKCAPDEATFASQRAQIGQWFQGWTVPERQGFFNRLLSIVVREVSLARLPSPFPPPSTLYSPPVYESNADAAREACSMMSGTSVDVHVRPRSSHFLIPQVPQGSPAVVDDLSAALGGVGMGSWGGASGGLGGFGSGSPAQQQIEASIGWMVLW